MTEDLKPIWTEKEVEKYNIHQKSGSFHVYKCDRKYDECEAKIQPRNYSNHGILIATTNGWVCPCGKYTQNWAHLI